MRLDHVFPGIRWSGMALALAVMGIGAARAAGQAAPQPAEGAGSASATLPPLSWVDASTGHRIHRLTSEPNSTGLYFNINAYTPDGKEMVYMAGDGIHALNLESMKTRLVVPGKNLHAIVVGKKTSTVYYTKNGELAL